MAAQTSLVLVNMTGHIVVKDAQGQALRVAVPAGTAKRGDATLLTLVQALVGTNFKVNTATIGSAERDLGLKAVVWVGMSTVKPAKPAKVAAVSTVKAAQADAQVPVSTVVPAKRYTLAELSPQELRAVRAMARVTGNRADVEARKAGLLG